VDTLLERGPELYASVYFGAIVVVALLEHVHPRRVPGETLRQRWFGNFSLTILCHVLVRIVFPVVGVGWAIVCEERGIGLLNQVQWPWWGELGLTILALDLAFYVQHVLLHRVPVLWRLHKTHHSDLEYDFTTGVRFHPFEALYTTGVVMAVTAAVGAPPWTVVISQLLSVMVAFVEHANVRVPHAIDRALRVVVVTPDMHRIHHSQDVHEGDSNFANTFSFWDRLFGTYVAEPAAGHDRIAFGVADFTEPKHQTLPGLLATPFRSSAATGARTGSPAPTDHAAS
jgi:sterol desaturase/sphingolipid hydroxylase (fatty acid hydroxylase superfamily)